MSVRTVQAVFTAVFEKLHADSRTQAVVQALRRGWISLDELRGDADADR